MGVAELLDDGVPGKVDEVGDIAVGIGEITVAVCVEAVAEGVLDDVPMRMFIYFDEKN